MRHFEDGSPDRMDYTVQIYFYTGFGDDRMKAIAGERPSPIAPGVEYYLRATDGTLAIRDAETSEFEDDAEDEGTDCVNVLFPDMLSASRALAHYLESLGPQAVWVGGAEIDEF